MSEANISATNQDGLLEITDGTRSYYLDLEPGDFSWSPGTQAPVVNLTRGKIAPLMGGAPDMRMADEAPCTGSFTARVRSLFSTTATTLMDLATWLATDVAGSNYVRENWVSTHAYSDARTLTLRYHLSGVYRGVPDQTAVYDYAVLRVGSVSEANPSTLSIDFTAGIVKPAME